MISANLLLSIPTMASQNILSISFFRATGHGQVSILPIFSLKESLTILLVYSGAVNSSLAAITFIVNAAMYASKEPHPNPNKRYFAVSLLEYLTYWQAYLVQQ
jgi:predicted benzoate:H+ symporter BenE